MRRPPRLCLLLGVALLVEAAGQQCPAGKQYEPAKPLGVSASIWGSSQYNASPAASNCCARGSIVSWTIQETGYSLNITYIGALSATCSDGSILSPINYGYNGTNAAFCNGALRQPQTVPTPDGNITARAGLLLDGFLDVGNSNAGLVEIECPVGLSPVGFSAASMCLALTLFQVICALPNKPAAAPVPVTSTLPSLKCPASVMYEPELPIGVNTSTWYFNNGAGTNNLTASPALAQCCPAGSIATWGIQTTDATSTTAGYIGSISATCSDGTSLAPVMYGYNGTDAALCNSTISRAVDVQAPRGNLTAIAGSILNSFLDVGDSSDSNPFYEIECPPGQSPVGFNAASMCFAVTAFQVICGVPQGHGPALAPGGLPPPLKISQSPTTPPAASSAAPPLPGQQCAANAQHVPTTALGVAGSIWYGTSYFASQATASCCASGSIVSWTLQTVTDKSPYSPYIGSITAACSDGSTVGPIRYGYNGTDGTRCNTGLRQPITVPAPNGTITARAGLLLDSLLNVGNNSSALVDIQCAPGLSPVGFSAGSMCLALTTFQVVCDVPTAPSPSAARSVPTPPPSTVSSPGQQCPAGVRFQPTLPIGLNSSEWYYADGSFTNLTASPATADCCPSGNITTWSVQSTNSSASAGFVGLIAATCSDGSKLGPVVYGFNGTGAPLCNTTISQPLQVSSPSGNITATGGAILNFLLNVGDASTKNPQFQIACGSGQSPVGFSAASMCYAITSFQVICGVPRQSAPAPAPGNSTLATTSSQSGGGGSSGGLSGGAIGGIVAGVLVTLAALTFVIVRRRRRMLPARPTPAVKRNESTQAMLPQDDADVFGMPQKVKVEASDVHSKILPSDSSPGSWNIPLNPLASDQKVLASGGLTIDTQDMKSVPALSSEASSSKDTGRTLSNKSSSHRRSTKSGSGSGSLATTASAASDDIRLDELQYVCNEKGQPLVLGKGAYGQVLKGLLGKGHDIPVAIKAVHENTSSSQRKSLLQEITLLRNLRHSNIVTLFGACQEGDTVLLVMEEMAGDLFHALHYQGSSELYRWKNRGRNVLLQLAEALNFIHFRRIIHFDLKTSNVLLTHDGIAKLTDVGLSGVLGSKTHLSQSQGFTMAYAAPEVLLGRACKASSDIYSFGVIMWEIVMGIIPERGRLIPIRAPEQCPKELSDLIDRCLSVDPEDRPTASSIVRVLQATQNAA